MAIGYGKSFSDEAINKVDKKRFDEEFKVIKEYEEYYLCGKYDKEGKLMYRECFAKFVIDGVKPINKKNFLFESRYYKF